MSPLAVAGITPHPALDGVACEMDGTHALARLGRWRGLAWRLQILLRDQWPSHVARLDDPWDCGWWRDGRVDAASAFRPRRATLLLIRDPDHAVAQDVLARLKAQCHAYARPLRVLVVSARPVPGVPMLTGWTAAG